MDGKIYILTGSLPPRGAWIEIRDPCGGKASGTRRSPHGERGLKYSGDDHPGQVLRSLPPRGAWIEMQNRAESRRGHMSLPPRGAWIEILHRFAGKLRVCGRSPHGERGLKLEMSGKSDASKEVAPPTGSVD